MRWIELLIKIADEHQMPYEEVEKVFLKYDSSACKGEISSQELWERMKKDLKLKKSAITDFFNVSVHTFTPIPETHLLIEKVIKHYSVGILTNIYRDVYEKCVEKGHIPNLSYHKVIQSCELGMAKPDAKIYQYAQLHAQVDANSILYIDDDRDNIKTATTLGWNTIMFNTNNPKKSVKEIERYLNIYSSC
jgi:FMN phosphatase YigB (HAD superfamily)